MRCRKEGGGSRYFLVFPETKNRGRAEGKWGPRVRIRTSGAISLVERAGARKGDNLARFHKTLHSTTNQNGKEREPERGRLSFCRSLRGSGDPKNKGNLVARILKLKEVGQEGA